MANPLATFRKYNKVLLTGVGILIILAFLIGDNLSSILGTGGGGGSSGPVPGRAVSFKGGALNEAQLSVMHVAENAAFDVMRRVYTETFEKKKTPREFPALLPSGSEYELVHKMLLAQKAHDLGMTLSDADIDRLLKQASDETLTDEDLRKIRNEVLGGYRSSRISISEKDIYAQLRTNFLAQEMLALLRSSTKFPQGTEGEIVDLMSQATPRMQVTPVQAWNYFRRMNRKVRTEVLPLEVEKFVDQVKGEPTAAQKDELFEKYKNVVANPASPEPGFAGPHEIAFGYVRVDFGKYLEEEKAKVTEEQLHAEYDKRVEAGEFRVPVLPEDKKDEAEKEEPKSDEAKPDEKPAESKPEEAKPEEAEKPKAEEPKAEDKPAVEEPTEEKSEGDAAATEDELTDDSSLEPEAQADETAESEAKEETKPEATAEEKPAATDEKSEAKPAEEPAKKEGDASGEAEKKPEGETPAEEGKKSEPKKPETRVRTFDEVKEDLRAQLARKPAQDRQEAALKEVEQIVRKYGAEYRAWDFERKQAEQKKKTNVSEKPELAPRLSAAVKKHSLSFKQLDLLDRYEVTQDELGTTSFFTGRGFAPFAQVYDSGLGLFEPVQIGGDLRDVTYLFWKEQDQEAKPAERKDVEDQIVRAWKMEKAYELALAEAKELAAKARDKESLRAAFPDGVDKAGAIQETSPFSWLTTGAMPFGMAAPELSRIPEVPYAGEEFMQTVMDLKPGEVGAAPDQPHKTVYVVRVISETPDEKALREMFLSQGIVNPNIAFQYAAERSEQLQTWMSNMEKDLQLTWHRPPENFQR